MTTIYSVTPRRFDKSSVDKDDVAKSALMMEAPRPEQEIFDELDQFSAS